jgi:hypothetical protein
MTTTTMATNTQKRNSKQRSVVAVLMQTFVNEKFNGDTLMMSKQTGISSSQIKRWINKGAVIVANSVYLRASKFDETAAQRIATVNALTSGTQVTPFNQHLDEHHRGRQTNFAEAHAIHQQQVNRWTKRSCVFLCGHVYREQRELSFDAKKVTVH